MNPLFDPNVAYVITVFALLLTILAILAPGTGFLEFGALVALLASGYSMVNITVNAWAIVLLLLGIVAVIFTIKRYTHWYFQALAIAVLVTGTVFLYCGPEGKPGADLLLVFVVSAVLIAFFWIVGRNTHIAFQQDPHQNLDKLIGKIGKARTKIYEEGSVIVLGEIWSATSEKIVPIDSDVRILGREGLILKVEAVKPKGKK